MKNTDLFFCEIGIQYLVELEQKEHMETLKEIVARCRNDLIELGFSPVEVRRELTKIAKQQVLAEIARKAFDVGTPIDQGPVWFGAEEWKTEFWKRQWEWQEAYRKGEATRLVFGSRDENPYTQKSFPYCTKMFELELQWNEGFKNIAE